MKTKVGIAVAAALALTTAISTPAQSSGADVYKAKCQSCHGVKGMAETPLGKALKVRPVTNAGVRKSTEAQMIEVTRNGVGKMQPFKGKLSDAEIKASVDYLRTFVK
jgi:mono/diheme cytochrome c family protein